MSTLKRLLDVRKKAKAKKPVFRRQDWHLRKKYGEGWKRPRGQQSKMRLKVAGRGALVNPGYRSPLDVRGMSRDGKEIVRVENMNQLQQVDGTNQTAIVSATVSTRNMVELLKHAVKSNISIYNVKNPAERIKEIEDTFKQKKKSEKAPEKKEEIKVEKKHEKKQDEPVDEKEQRREAEKLTIQK